MTSITIKTETFTAAGFNPRGIEVGTVKVDLGRGATVTARAIRHNDGDITVAGFVGRYRTSTKAWRATVYADANGKIFAHFGRDDRAGRFQKLEGITWEPDTFTTLTNPAYWIPA